MTDQSDGIGCCSGARRMTPDPKGPAMTDQRGGLLGLAERCEKSEGPNIALEQAIAMAVYGAQATDVTGITVVDGIAWRFPAYTASLDAAMTLVPEGQESELLHAAWRAVSNRHALHVRFWKRNADGDYAQALARQVAAAALRARAAITLATGAAS